MSQSPKSPPPFLIAHRAGNDLARLQSAEQHGVALIECDVHLRRGRLEVWHLKRIGPIPIIWDRWQLRRPWVSRLLLSDLLEAIEPGTELMLDLKGFSPRLAGPLTECLDAFGAGRRFTVCSRNWRVLAALPSRDDVRIVHSVGSRGQLRTLRERLRLGQPVAGISIHKRLLDAPIVAELKRDIELIVSWPIETMAEAHRLGTWGVDGMISKRFDALRL
jgi:glycerophosphoryl diester phosphodiesterase